MPPHSYACIQGRGTHQAVEKLQYWLKKIHRQGKEYYCLKMDVAKYFYRIDHSALMRILKRKIKDKNNKTYITVELIVKPGSELDLRKYLLLQSINDNIYKISNVFKRDKENVIELMFKV